MSDAMTDAYRMESEGEAEDTFISSLIPYLHTPNKKNRFALEQTIQKLVTKGNGDLETFHKTIAKFDSNDHPTWKELIGRKEKTFFQRKPDLKDLFYKAARKRKIGNLQWVI